MLPRLGLSFLLLTALLVVAVHSAAIFENGDDLVPFNDSPFQADEPEEKKSMARSSGKKKNSSSSKKQGSSSGQTSNSNRQSQTSNSNRQSQTSNSNKQSQTSNSNRQSQTSNSNRQSQTDNSNKQSQTSNSKKPKRSKPDPKDPTKEMQPRQKKPKKTRSKQEKETNAKNRKQKMKKNKPGKKKAAVNKSSKFKEMLKEIKDKAKEAAKEQAKELLQSLKDEAIELAKEVATNWIEQTAINHFCECTGNTCQCCSRIPLVGSGCLNAEVTINEDEYYFDVVIKKDIENEDDKELASITMEESSTEQAGPTCAKVDKMLPEVCIEGGEVSVYEDGSANACFTLNFATLSGTFCLDYANQVLAISKSSE